MVLLITNILKDCIWGQYEAALVSDEPIHIDVNTGEFPGATKRVTVETGGTCTVDFMQRNHSYAVGDTITIENGKHMLTSYAKNPAMGIVVIVYNSVKK
jgi:hypothetical protein